MLTNDYARGYRNGFRDGRKEGSKVAENAIDNDLRLIYGAMLACLAERGFTTDDMVTLLNDTNKWLMDRKDKPAEELIAEAEDIAGISLHNMED